LYQLLHEHVLYSDDVNDKSRLVNDFTLIVTSIEHIYTHNFRITLIVVKVTVKVIKCRKMCKTSSVKCFTTHLREHRTSKNFPVVI
jgi:hypothetical protein